MKLLTFLDKESRQKAILLPVSHKRLVSGIVTPMKNLQHGCALTSSQRYDRESSIFGMLAKFSQALFGKMKERKLYNHALLQ